MLRVLDYPASSIVILALLRPGSDIDTEHAVRAAAYSSSSADVDAFAYAAELSVDTETAAAAAAEASCDSLDWTFAAVRMLALMQQPGVAAYLRLESALGRQRNSAIVG